MVSIPGCICMRDSEINVFNCILTWSIVQQNDTQEMASLLENHQFIVVQL